MDDGRRTTDYQIAGYQDNRISGNGSQIRGEYQILNEKCRIAKGGRLWLRMTSVACFYSQSLG